MINKLIHLIPIFVITFTTQNLPILTNYKTAPLSVRLEPLL